jgi:uncharacterized membrane protein YfcA
MLFAALGVAAGLITTVSGFGGGMLLVSCLAIVWDPLAAITVSSVALLVGNAQRLFMFRAHVRPRVAAQLVAGAIPGSLLGAMVATSLPGYVLQSAIIGITGLALARSYFGGNWALPIRALGPGAAAVGALAAMSGGGGFLLGPMVMSAGITGNAFLATGAVTAVFIHIARLTGYAAGGIIERDMMATAIGIAGCIVVGNVLGRSVRRRLSETSQGHVEHGVMVACAAAAIAGAL